MPLPRNYIKRLEAEKAELESRIAAIKEAAADFRRHLDTPKFTEPAADGSRTDWIATADVHARLRNLESI